MTHLLSILQSRFDNAVARIATPEVPAKGSLIYWRANLLAAILITVLLGGVPATATGIAVGIREKAWGLIAFDLFAWLMAVYMIFSHRVPYTARAVITLLMFYAVGMVVLFNVGPLSGGSAWLFAFAVLVGVLLGARPAICAVLLNAASISIVAWLVASNRIDADFPFFANTATMLSAGVNFILLNAVAAISVAILVKGLVRTSEHARIAADRLAQEQIQLVEAKKALESQIEERTQAERALRDSREKYRRFIENAPIAMYTLDTRGHFTYGNRKLLEITGYRLEDWLNRPFHPLVHEDDLAFVTDKIVQRLAGKGDSNPYEIRIYHATGAVMWVEIISESIYARGADGTQELVGMQSFLTDITRRKKAETELQQTRKMESIGTLAGGIAHDFNNILGIIVGNTELALEDTPDYHPVHMCLGEIKAASLRAAGIVKQLLNFSRKSERQLKPVDAVPVLTDVLRFLKSTIPSTIAFRWEIPETAMPILADPIQLNQVMINICTNAHQAMEGHGGRLDVVVEKAVIPDAQNVALSRIVAGTYLKIIVRDTGPGIPPANIDRIFDPYYTTKPFGEGMGMGLSVVHGIVKEHDGHITVDSTPGDGTTFTLFFPLTTALPEPAFETPASIEGGCERLLFVDDEPAIVQLAVNSLERLGYHVEAFSDPLAAAKRFQSSPQTVDAVISDVTMPGMDGIRFAEHIRSLRSELPIIICTGHSALIDSKRAEALGIDAFVMKPIETHMMAATLRKVLDGEQT